MSSGAGLAMVISALTFLALPRGADAQDWRRSGFWFEMGGGFASVRVACSTCTDVTRSSTTGNHIRFGGTISRKVLLGVEIFSMRNEMFGLGSESDSLVAENASLAAVALWYPWRPRIFVKAGMGMAAGEFTVNTTSADPILTEGLGVGLTFGVGFDQPVWRGFAVTGNAGVWFTAIGDVVLPATRVDDVIATMYNAAIGITIR